MFSMINNLYILCFKSKLKPLLCTVQRNDKYTVFECAHSVEVDLSYYYFNISIQ